MSMISNVPHKLGQSARYNRMLPRNEKGVESTANPTHTPTIHRQDTRPEIFRPVWERPDEGPLAIGRTTKAALIFDEARKNAVRHNEQIRIRLTRTSWAVESKDIKTF